MSDLKSSRYFCLDISCTNNKHMYVPENNTQILFVRYLKNICVGMLDSFLSAEFFKQTSCMLPVPGTWRARATSWADAAPRPRSRGGGGAGGAGAGAVLGDDRAPEPPVQGQAREGHLGPPLQQAALHELPGRPRYTVVLEKVPSEGS